MEQSQCSLSVLAPRPFWAESRTLGFGPSSAVSEMRGSYLSTLLLGSLPLLWLRSVVRGHDCTAPRSALADLESSSRFSSLAFPVRKLFFP